MRTASSLSGDYSPLNDYRRFAGSPLYSGYTKRGGHMTVSQLILLQCLTIAAGYDLRERRIPHALIYTYLCSGYFLSCRSVLTLSKCFFFSSGGGVPYLLRYVLSFVMFRVLASLTHAGGGDARLMALVIAWCGVDAGCRLLLPGLVLALLYLLWIRTASGAVNVFVAASGPPSASRCDSGTDLLSRVVRFISLPLNPEPARREILSEK